MGFTSGLDASSISLILGLLHHPNILDVWELFARLIDSKKVFKQSHGFGPYDCITSATKLYGELKEHCSNNIAYPSTLCCEGKKHSRVCGDRRLGTSLTAHQALVSRLDIGSAKGTFVLVDVPFLFT